MPLDTQPAAPVIVQVPIGNLEPSRSNTRKDYDLEDLAASIVSHGVQTPILARMLQDDRYEIIAGERRFRAAKKAGLPSVPVIVTNEADRHRLVSMQIIENLQRQDLAPIEEAGAFAHYLALPDHTGTKPTTLELAKQIGKSVDYVQERLQLLRLDPEVRRAVTEGKLPLKYARFLARIPDGTAQKEACNHFMQAETPGQWEIRTALLTGSLSLTDATFPLRAPPGCLSCPKLIPAAEIRTMLEAGKSTPGIAISKNHPGFCGDRACYIAKTEAAIKKAGQVPIKLAAAQKKIKGFQTYRHTVAAHRAACPGCREKLVLISSDRAGVNVKPVCTQGHGNNSSYQRTPLDAAEKKRRAQTLKRNRVAAETQKQAYAELEKIIIAKGLLSPTGIRLLFEAITHDWSARRVVSPLFGVKGSGHDSRQAILKKISQLKIAELEPLVLRSVVAVLYSNVYPGYAPAAEALRKLKRGWKPTLQKK